MNAEKNNSIQSHCTFLIHDLILFNEEKDLSAVAVETGNVVKMQSLNIWIKFTIAD